MEELNVKKMSGGDPAVKVSVIIPTYNRAEYIADALRSALSQHYQDFEIVIVDDGSTDGTRDIVAGFDDPRIRYLLKDNGGVSSARNLGIRESSGEYLAFLDSDDIWFPDNLAKKVSVLDAHPDAGLVCSDAYLFDGSTGTMLGRRWHDHGSPDRIDPRKAARAPFKQLLKKGCFITPQATLVRRSVFARAGYFDESLRTHEDWDLFTRVAKLYPICLVDVPLLKIRKHDGNLTASWRNMYRSAVTVLGRAPYSLLLNRAELRLLNQRLARTHFSYGKSQILAGEIEAGRKKLRQAIATRPLYLRPYFYLAGSTLGFGPISTIRTFMKAVRRTWEIYRNGGAYNQ